MKIDKKCPFLGNISLRGKLYIGNLLYFKDLSNL